MDDDKLPQTGTTYIPEGFDIDIQFVPYTKISLDTYLLHDSNGDQYVRFKKCDNNPYIFDIISISPHETSIRDAVVEDGRPYAKRQASHWALKINHKIKRNL